MRWWWLIAACAQAACARPATRAGAPAAGVAAAHAGADAAAAAPAPTARPPTSFELTWNGQRIGSAHERFVRHPTGLTFSRREVIALRRGARIVHLRTEIEADLTESGAGLRLERVVATRASDAGNYRAVAARTSTGDWQITVEGEPPRTLPGAAVPLELVPHLLGRERRFQGPVMLPGYGFAVADVYARPDDAPPSRVDVALVTEAGVLAQTLWLDATGAVLRVSAGDGVEATRAEPGALEGGFDPPEIADTAAIAVAGRPDRTHPLRLALGPIDSPSPPSLPGQTVRAEGSTWHITLGGPAAGIAPVELAAAPAPEPPERSLAKAAAAIVASAGARAPLAELRALALYTDRMIDDDLGGVAGDARATFALGRGDCTAHARLFAAFAAARGHRVRLITGLRLDDGDAGWRLVRHRWVAVEVGDTWVQVDPTYAEAPARPRLIGLAVHGSSAAELALIDEVAFAGLAHARAAFR